jgi:hypothetical protein
MFRPSGERVEDAFGDGTRRLDRTIQETIASAERVLVEQQRRVELAKKRGVDISSVTGRTLE